MAELKTRPTGESVRDFIDAIPDPQQKKDARRLATLMRKVTGARAEMWGPSIVGFGRYRYANTAGKNFEWMLTGFSPRKQALSLYIMSGFSEYEALLGKLGKHKTGKSCLYVKRLADIDERVLERLVAASVAAMRERYETN